jgi:hypothetical protein
MLGARLQRTIGGAAQYGSHALPILYLAWALPFLITLAWVTPPWCNPDEPNHMLRIAELAHGELIGQRFNARDAGGISDPGILEAAAPFEGIKFHPDQKITLPMLRKSQEVRWRDGPALVGFANTAPYPPALYLPGVLAVWASWALGFDIDDTLLATRIAMALSAAVATAASLALAGRCRYAITALAMLPMTCSLEASASQDALLIGLSLLVVGWIDHIIAMESSASRRQTAGIALVLAAIAMARPAYVTLALLPLLMWRRIRWRAIAAGCTVLVGCGAWCAFAAATVLVYHGDPSVQIMFLYHHPTRIGSMLLVTVEQQYQALMEQFIGRLGWLDTALPRWFVWFAFAVLASCFVSAWHGESRRPWLPLMSCCGAVALVFALQYLSWTAPGSDLVDGVQGRYFIPVAVVFALAMPSWRGLGARARPFALVGLASLGVVTPVVVVHALVMRYYLGG